MMDKFCNTELIICLSYRLKVNAVKNLSINTDLLQREKKASSTLTERNSHKVQKTLWNKSKLSLLRSFCICDK